MSRFQILASTNNFHFLKQITQTRDIQTKTEKMNITTEFITVLNFGTKFSQNRPLPSKIKKVSITIEFGVFELV